MQGSSSVIRFPQIYAPPRRIKKRPAGLHEMHETKMALSFIGRF